MYYLIVVIIYIFLLIWDMGLYINFEGNDILRKKFLVIGKYGSFISILIAIIFGILTEAIFELLYVGQIAVLFLYSAYNYNKFG